MSESLLALFEDCQHEADAHSSVGLYGDVSFDEVLKLRGAEWLAAHDAKVRAETLHEAADEIAVNPNGGAWLVVLRMAEEAEGVVHA